MTEYSDWLNELGTKPEYAHAKSLFDKLNFKMGEIFSMRDELEKLPSYDYPERGEKDHPISIVVDILCFMANAMNTRVRLGPSGRSRGAARYPRDRYASLSPEAGCFCSAYPTLVRRRYP